MADGNEGPSDAKSPPGAVRRVATDPITLEERPSQDREAATAPRVRFSEDLNRATVSAAPGKRPGTPDLSINTRIGGQVSSEGPKPAARILSKRTIPASPTSPRTRDRGYSLRRTLFARTINNQSELSSVEIVEAGPSSAAQDDLVHRQENDKSKRSSSITVSPVLGNDLAISQNSLDEPLFESPERTKDKKGRGPIHLPNYDLWATQTAKSNAWLRKLKYWKKQASKFILRQTEIPPSKDGRHIDLDAARKTTLIDERTGHAYIGNAIRSSRYTVWNFVPRQLFFQFSKLANAYFLLVSVLQMVPGLSTTGNYTTIAPLLVFVMISMGKEGYDDVRRYKLDQVENSRATLVLHTHKSTEEVQEKKPSKSLKTLVSSNGRKEDTNRSNEGDVVLPIEGPNQWASLKWRDVKVGDIIKLNRDEPVPADMLLLHSDGVNGIAYIETMALDGETNLKSKQAPPNLAKSCNSIEEITLCRAIIVVEDPNLDLYNFDGRVNVEGETLPLTTNEIIFRGSTLRNTSTVIGMVINTGEECKIRMNANKNPRIKAPAIQFVTNKIVIMLVIFVVLLALFCTIAYQIWSRHTESKAWYLRGAHVNFTQIIIGFIILYNTLIPLSLYVSLEIIKVGQLILMADVEMYDPVSDTPMTCNTTTILENLGQVDYIFSDKTGTLTDNIMRFRKLSVAGYAWLHDFDLQKEAAEFEASQETSEPSEKKSKGKGIANRHSRKRSRRPAIDRSNMSAETSGGAILSPAPRRSGSIWRSTARPNKAQPELRTEELLKFMQQKPHSVFTKKAKFFLLSMALCHTCLPEVKENGDIEFQAASPDELALVKAAQELGYLVIDRAARSITLNCPAGSDSTENITESYDILDVIEFSSKRKRMSIVVRFPNGRICLFCKGADSAIMPRLKLAPLALQKKAEVTRRSSQRKSLEAEEALRRMSEHSPRNSFSLNRGSLSLSRKSIGYGRPSIASTKLRPIRDELDIWLQQRENDVEAPGSDDMSAYQSPRVSTNRMSFASSERRSSAYFYEEFEDIVDEALVLDEAAVFERCFQHIDDFASEGLRTLLFGYKFLDEQEYAGWKKIYLDATTSLVDRQKLIENAGEMIEQNFELAGATAIEDKLQKGVPETIDKLRRANIKIWMLTGDKRETAINIAHSARICKPYSDVVILDHNKGEVEQRMATTLLDITKGTIPHSVVVVDGQTLSEIDANETLSRLFFDLVVLADSVICCRASPSQKASLVKKIRTKVNKSLTLAIGDGANDIAMIQEAHVGIGISGKEGLQAARISDYSIAQFRFLQRLLLVHGRWNYIRTGKYILATFWKELMFYLIQALYQRWCGYTGTSLFESTSLTVFNTLFTSLPVIFLGVFEQDLQASTLLAVPELYTMGQRNEGFNIKKYVAWMFMAVSGSMIIYFIMFGLWGEALIRDDNLLSMGTLAFTAAIVFINTKLLLLEMHNKTITSLFGWVLSVGGWFFWTIILSALYKPSKTYLLYPIKDGFLYQFGNTLLWWLVLFLTLACLIVLELGVSSIRKSFWPTDTDLFQELQKDPLIRQRFEERLRAEEAGEPTPALNDKIKSSMENQLEREGEIQELLDRRRVMSDAEVVRSPIDLDGSADAGGLGQGNLTRSASGGNLTRRKFSVDRRSAGFDVEEFELQARVTATSPGTKTRHSIDVAEVLGRR